MFQAQLERGQGTCTTCAMQRNKLMQSKVCAASGFHFLIAALQGANLSCLAKTAFSALRVTASKTS